MMSFGFQANPVPSPAAVRTYTGSPAQNRGPGD